METNKRLTLRPLKHIISDIPYGTTILIVGSPGTGQNHLATNFLYEGLIRDEYGIYFGLSWSLETLNRNVDAKFKKAIDEGNIRVFDEKSKQFISLNQISVNLFKDIKKHHHMRGVIDSISILALKFGAENVLPWILSIRNQVHGKKIIVLKILETGMHPIGFENSVRSLYDTVIETKSIENDEGNLKNYFRIRNSSVTSYDTNWQIIPNPPKKMVTFTYRKISDTQ